MPSRPTRSLLQGVADTLLPEESHREFNFGLLDLGALVCRYVEPRHSDCPLRDICDYAEMSAKGVLEETGAKRTPLRELRQAKGLSLVELAKRAGVSKLTVIKIEASLTEPKESTLRKLAEALGVSIEDLTPHS